MTYFETRIYTDATEYIRQLNAAADKVSDLTEPLTTIATSWEASVRARFTSGGPGWAALAPTTIDRWGAHSILINSGSPGDLFGSIHHFARNNIAGVFATQGHAALHDSYGRKAGSGGARSRRGGGRRAGRLLRGEKKHGYDIEAEGRIKWGAMPRRPFMFTDDVMKAFALTTIAEYITADFGD